MVPPSPPAPPEAPDTALAWPGLMDHIQPHGWLLVLDMDNRVRQASANVADLCGRPLSDILDQPVDQVIGRGAARILQRALNLNRVGIGPLTVTLVTGHRRLRVVMQGHWDAAGLVLELEAAVQSDGGIVAAGFGAAIRRYRHLQTAEDLAVGIAHDARLLTGFDRAMVVRIGRDGTAAVIAEATPDEVVSVPSRPIAALPPAAIALLELNRVRLLADVTAAPVPVLPAASPLTNQPLNLSRAILRPATEAAAAHAQERGMRTVLVVSLVCGGRLWGYLWCESRRPRGVSVPVRALFEGLGEIAAAQIAAMEERASADDRTRATRALARLGRQLRDKVEMVQALAELRPVLQDILPHDAMAVSIDGKGWSSPDTMPAAHWLRLLDAGASGAREGLRWMERAADMLTPDEAGMANLLDIDLHGGHVLLLRRAGGGWSLTEREVAQELYHLLSERRAELYRRRTERELHQLTNFDRVTGLPNRDHLLRALEQALQVEADVAVAVLGLDRFRALKATLGEEAADHLLAAVGQRLRENVGSADLVARIDTGEFAVLLLEDGPARINALAAAIRDALRRPVIVNDRDIFVTASIGLVNHATAAGAAGMLRDAEIASAEAEAAGGGRRTFDDAMRARLTERQDIYDRLRQAIYYTDGVRAVYQPIMRLSDGHLSGFEALARWTDPDHGPIPPAVFVPVAEQTGLIMPLGNHILIQACRQIVRWNRDRVGPPLYISVNLSPYQMDPARLDLVRWVTGVLEMTGCRPEWLQLEITESGLIGQGGAAPEILKGLRQLGVGLAIDDFGTGYSSLAYLQELPVDTIKIDRSFVQRMAVSEKGMALVRAILHIAGIMEYGVVAEGVETDDQAGLLRDMGCERAQGYFYAKPLEHEAASALAHHPEIAAELLRAPGSAGARLAGQGRGA